MHSAVYSVDSMADQTAELTGWTMAVHSVETMAELTADMRADRSAVKSALSWADY